MIFCNSVSLSSSDPLWSQNGFWLELGFLCPLPIILVLQITISVVQRKWQGCFNVVTKIKQCIMWRTCLQQFIWPRFSEFVVIWGAYAVRPYTDWIFSRSKGAAALLLRRLPGSVCLSTAFFDILVIWGPETSCDMFLNTSKCSFLHGFLLMKIVCITGQQKAKKRLIFCYST